MVTMFVRNCWYVAAWSDEVLPGQLFARTLLGEPVCFFRRLDGTVAAVRDRCAHRGAPLSRGRIEGDAVRCLYHGLKFDADGVCVEVPGQDRIPPRACVRRYPVVERHGWIWIWMGEIADADPVVIPDAWSLDHKEWRYKPGYHRFDAPHMLICDNLLDFSHIGYVHATTLGGTENIALNRPVVRRDRSSVRVERWLMNDVPAPFHTRVATFPGLVDRWHFYDFHVPGVLIMHSGVQATGTGAPEGLYRDALEFRSCQAVTPETTGSSHYFYAVPRNFALEDATVTETIFQDVVTAFEEDRGMIEAQARTLALTPDAVMVPIAADAALAQFRRLMVERLSIEGRSLHLGKGELAPERLTD